MLKEHLDIVCIQLCGQPGDTGHYRRREFVDIIESIPLDDRKHVHEECPAMLRRNAVHLGRIGHQQSGLGADTAANHQLADKVGNQPRLVIRVDWRITNKLQERSHG